MISCFKRMLQTEKFNPFGNNKNVKNYILLDKFIICKTILFSNEEKVGSGPVHMQLLFGM